MKPEILKIHNMPCIVIKKDILKLYNTQRSKGINFL